MMDSEKIIISSRVVDGEIKITYRNFGREKTFATYKEWSNWVKEKGITIKNINQIKSDKKAIRLFKIKSIFPEMENGN